MRAIDFHVHLPTPDWLDGSMAGYVEAAEAYFRSRVERQSLESLAAKYRALDAQAVLLAWDAETATGRPRVRNATVAAAVSEHPDAFTGIGSVDPHKESAVDEVAEIAALGLRGVKFHPSLQAFAPDDEKFWPVFAACESHGLLALFHTGTSGIGARQPGGQGIRLDYSHPLKLDGVAAAFPALTVVAAHFGWPWHMDLLAMALHKTNVYIDISGWSPKRIPPEVIRELKGRLAGQFVWGSDFPFIEPQRCLGELAELGLDSPVLLRDNAARILGLPGLPASRFCGQNGRVRTFEERQARAMDKTSEDATRWWQAYLLAESDQDGELRERADAGDEHARRELASWLADRLRTEDAIEVIRPLAEAGDSDADLWLARWLADGDHLAELRQRAADGSYPALHELAEWLAGHQRLDEVRELVTEHLELLAGWLGRQWDRRLMRLAADLGDKEAGWRLEQMLAHLRERAASGHESAQRQLAEWPD